MQNLRFLFFGLLCLLGLGVSQAQSLPNFTFAQPSPVLTMSPSGDGSLTISNIVITNTGAAASNSQLQWSVYYSTDPTVTTSDYRITSTEIHLGPNASSGPLSVSIGTWHYRNSNIPVGTYYVGLILDPDQQVQESNEGDNVIYTSPLTVQVPPVLPNINIWRYSSPWNINITAGTAFSVRNSANYLLGNMPINPGVVRFFLSTDTLYQATDIPLRAANDINAVAEWSYTTPPSDVFEHSMQLPPNQPFGRYYVLSLMDFTGTTNETSEEDNIAYTNIEYYNPILPAPSNLSAVSLVDANAVRLTWTDNASTETGYQIEYQEIGSTGWVRVNQTSPNIQETTVTRLLWNSVYRFRVRAIGDNSSASPYSSEVSATTSATIYSTAASQIRIDGFTFDWSGSADHFRMDVATDAGFTSFIPGYNNLLIPGNIYTQEVSGLTAGTSYYVRMRAVNSAGVHTSYTPTIQLTLPASPALPNFTFGPSSPILTMSPSGDGSLTISNIVITNTGAAASNSQLQWSVYYSTDPTVTTSDYKILGNLGVNTLPGLISVSIDTWHYRNSSIPVGTYYVGLILDPDQQVQESNEDDNVIYTSPLTVQVPPVLPNINIWRYSSPRNINVTAGTAFSVRNGANYLLGNMPINPGVVRFFLSTDTLYQATDIPLRAANDINAVAEWSYTTPPSDVFEHSMQLPPNLPFGQYYVLSLMDFTGTTNETSEEDNTAYASIEYYNPILPAPSNLSAVSLVDANAVRLTWTDNASTETGYQIDYQRSSGTHWTRASQTGPNTQEATVNLLDWNSVYRFRVRAIGDNGSASPYSSEASTTTSAIIYSYNVTQIRADGFSFNLYGSADHYRMDIATDADFTNFAPGYNNLLIQGNTSSQQVNNLQVNNLAPGPNYYVRMRAVNSAGVHTSYTPTFQLVLASTNAVPTALPAINVMATSFTAYWQTIVGLPSSNSYHLQVSTTPDFVPPHVFEGSFISSNQWMITGLNNNQTYYYRVRHVQTNSSFSNTITVNLPPNGGRIAAQSSAVPGGMRIQWPQVLNADRYVVEVSENATFGQQSPGYQRTETRTTEAVISLPKSNTMYHYRVSTHVSTNIIAQSDVATQLTTPAAPQDLRVSRVGNLAINRLEWTNPAANAAGVSLLVERALTSSNDFTLLATLAATATSWEDNTAVAGQGYQYRLRALNEAGSTNSINSVSQVTGIADDALSAHMQIFPNPGRIIQVSLQGLEGTAHYELSDLTGRSVLQGSADLSEGTWQLDLTQAGAGTYVLTVRTPKGIAIKRIVRE